MLLLPRLVTLASRAPAPALPHLRRCYSTTTTSTFTNATHEPLRILFCGSDDFSIASLLALHREHQRDPAFIASIDVVHRPSKRTGRGLKTIREVPIATTASTLSLPTHPLDTFTRWTPPSPGPNLIVAVSFGLLIPARILSAARFGGLNVHPSLLPDLHGAAPIHRALLRGDTRTGISVQTLHPRHFDRGTVLARRSVSITEPETCGPEALVAQLAPIGAEELVRVLRERRYVDPVEAAAEAEAGADADAAPPQHAAKIQKSDSQVTFDKQPASSVLRTLRVLGSVWDETTFSHLSSAANPPADVPPRRIVYHALSRLAGPAPTPLPPLKWWVLDAPADAKTKSAPAAVPRIATLAADGDVLVVDSCTVDGGRRGEGTRVLARLVEKAGVAGAGAGENKVPLS